MTVVKVQDCGCIALPEEVVAATGLNPGATLSIELTPDKDAILIKPIERTESQPPATGVQCNRKADAHGIAQGFSHIS